MYLDGACNRGKAIVFVWLCLLVNSLCVPIVKSIIFVKISIKRTKKKLDFY